MKTKAQEMLDYLDEASLIKQGKNEESPGFYRLLVGAMKKNLGLINKRRIKL